MRKMLLLVLAAVISATVISGCSKGYESQRSAGDARIILKADRYPLIMGDNGMTVIVADPAGKAITDAKVAVRFYMPPMPGMAPMDSTPQTTLKGGGYSFTVNPGMAGGWKVDVTVTRQGKTAATTTFNVDAR
jgi:hypothetical protein